MQNANGNKIGSEDRYERQRRVLSYYFRINIVTRHVQYVSTKGAIVCGVKKAKRITALSGQPSC